ncbi:hypothetical protein MTO96_007268 [Rhipicephalus appendiculatus]
MEGFGDVRIPAKVKPSTWPPVKAQQQREGSLTRSSVRRPSRASTTAATASDTASGSWWRGALSGDSGWKWRAALLLALLVVVAVLGLVTGAMFAKTYLDAPAAV